MHNDKGAYLSKASPSRRSNMLALTCGVLIFGPMVWGLYQVSNQNVHHQFEPHIVRAVAGLALFALYIALLVPASDGLRRVMQIHSTLSFGAGHLKHGDEKVEQPLQAVETLLKFQVFGIASAPALLTLTTAAVFIVPWTMLVFRHDAFGISDYLPYGIETPSIPIARNLRPDHPKWAAHEEDLKYIIHRGFVNGQFHGFEPTFHCDLARTKNSTCSWEGYATMETRARCTEITGELKISDNSSVFQALKDITSIPTYSPSDWVKNDAPTVPIMSLKNTTFVTLSDLHSHTGPWKTVNNHQVRAEDKGQISKETLEKLHRFSFLVMNSVSPSEIQFPIYNQTLGTLQNFHFVYAEMGITGHFEDDELKWINLEEGLAIAEECSIDIGVRPKWARYSQEGFVENNVFDPWRHYWEMMMNGEEGLEEIVDDFVVPLNPLAVNRTCSENPESCGDSKEETLNFLWNNMSYSVDHRITSQVSQNLHDFFRGSSFNQGWISTVDKWAGSLTSMSKIAHFLHAELYRSIVIWNWDNLAKRPYWSFMPKMSDVTASLNSYLRHYYCGKNCAFAHCPGDHALGERLDDVHHHHHNNTSRKGSGQNLPPQLSVAWEWLAYPASLLVLTAVIMLVAALNEKYHRIRLPESNPLPGEAGASSGEKGTDTPEEKALSATGDAVVRRRLRE